MRGQVLFLQNFYKQPIPDHSLILSEDNIKEWTGIDFVSSTRAAENRIRWIGIVANSSVMPRRPSNVIE